ncbi:hypothetical protein LIER_15948 [Lithospermum erythrorhizon]|uniref:Uncharacterized protein n=1 Tax=Lithospermum erythrorhizon TaxID=34254 RepID=A0AAV3Q9F3_LITER
MSNTSETETETTNNATPQTEAIDPPPSLYLPSKVPLSSQNCSLSGTYIHQLCSMEETHNNLPSWPESSRHC